MRGCNSFRNLMSRHLESSLNSVSLGILSVLCMPFRQRRSPSSSDMSSMIILDPTTHQGTTSTSGPPSRGSAGTGVSQLSCSQPFGRRCRWTTSPLLSPVSSAHGAPYLTSMFRAICRPTLFGIRSGTICLEYGNSQPECTIWTHLAHRSVLLLLRRTSKPSKSTKLDRRIAPCPCFSMGTCLI